MDKVDWPIVIAIYGALLPTTGIVIKLLECSL